MFAAVSLVAVPYLLVACADDGPRSVAQVINVRMHDFSIEIPERLRAGTVELQGVNDGDYEHMAWIVAIPEGETFESFRDGIQANFFGLFDGTVRLFGGLQFVQPGREQTTVVNLPSGDYAIICVIAGPEPGESHLTRGMISPFTVAPTGFGEPSAEINQPIDGTIELIDFAFAVPEQIESGAVYDVVNTGSMPHEVAISTMPEGATRDDVRAELQNGDLRAPYENVGGTTIMSPGQHQLLTIDLPPGRYVFVCYAADVNRLPDLVQHFDEGMIQIVDIV